MLNKVLFMPKYNDYTYKSLNKLISKAIHQYDMISDGDVLAVGLSGGKDSLSLMWALNDRRSKVLVNFSLLAIYVDLGFDSDLSEKITRYCERENYDFVVERSNFGPLAHSDKNKENPCFLCSHLRRKQLFETAARFGCNKLALGHNKDDIIETLFLNIFYSGEISTMMPFQSVFGGRMKIIRPLAFVDKENITKFAIEKKGPQFYQSLPIIRQD